MLDRLQRVIALLKNPAVPRLPKALVIAAIVYLLMPLDLVPDVPVAGWLEDLLFLWFALGNLLNRADPPASATAPGGGAVPTAPNDPVVPKGPIIDVTPEK